MPDWPNCRPQYPEVEALTDLYGIGLFSAMVIVSEFGDVCRFRTAKQAGAYTGLTPRVSQSGSHCHLGHISKQGPPSLRWILVEAAMKIARKDIGLANFHTRIRRRSDAQDRACGHSPQAGGDLLETIATLAPNARRTKRNLIPESDYCGAQQSVGTTRTFRVWRDL